MTKCDYCGEKVGFFSGRYRWIDKEDDYAMHNKCYKEYLKKLPDMLKKEENWYYKLRQIDFNILSQSERNKIFDDYIKSTSYSRRGSKKISKDKQIRYLEEYIEKVKKADYPGKENNLKEAIEKLSRLKNEDVK